MPRNRDIALSRRAVLKVAAAGGVSLLVLQPRAAFGASRPSEEALTADIDSYVAATMRKGLTTLDGIHAEYREAASKFPFALPSGWTFPAESSLTNPLTSVSSADTEVLWERGNGAAEVYLYWQSAVATEAYEAHLRGDSAQVERSLNQLESGYSSVVRRAVLEDPSDGFLKIEVAAARGGDFKSLKSVAID